MNWIRPLLPVTMAGVIIGGALLFVRYYNAYEAPGEYWAPASPVVHENSRFMADMGAAGDYRVQIEKLRSKLPLLFVEYQPPGPILDVAMHSDDGVLRLDERFADEGDYRIIVQDVKRPGHRQVVDFVVQTPLAKYSVDVLLLVLLLAAGFVSGRRLRTLARMALLAAVVIGGGMPSAWAHGGHHRSAPSVAQEQGGLTLAWAAGRAPTGAANRSPMDWRLQILNHGLPVSRAAYALDFLHLESGHPVLHLEGVAVNGEIPLRYSPPDGTDYRLLVRAVVDGRVHHLALEGAAEAIRPTTGRQWASFLLLMTPVVIGMAWGWKRGATG